MAKMAVPNFSKKIMVLIWNGHSEFFPSIFPKKTGINSEWPKLGIPNLFEPF